MRRWRQLAAELWTGRAESTPSPNNAAGDVGIVADGSVFNWAPDRGSHKPGGLINIEDVNVDLASLNGTIGEPQDMRAVLYSGKVTVDSAEKGLNVRRMQKIMKGFWLMPEGAA